MAAIFLLAMFAARLQLWQAEKLSGQAHVIDGDSLSLASRRLRLGGIDAPELDQTCLVETERVACGRQAADYLRGLVGNRDVNCLVLGRDRYHRDLVSCRAGDVPLNAEMVRAGWAVSYGGYAAEEANARAERAGIWAGEFERPAQWRRTHGGRVEPVHSSTNGFWAFLRRLFGVR